MCGDYNIQFVLWLSQVDSRPIKWFEPSSIAMSLSVTTPLTQLRYALGIKYPRVITNQQFYDHTKCEPWNFVTERRRLSWHGHLTRLNPETPARQSFKEALRPAERKPDRPPTTWIPTIQQDLTKRGINAIKELELMCHDRAGWKARCSMRGTHETSPLNP